VTGRCFSRGTYCHDITEILWKVALNTINLNLWGYTNIKQHPDLGLFNDFGVLKKVCDASLSSLFM
jgi:hypothetical protein